MSLKKEILSLLEENRGTFLSGAEIATRMNVTRSAVWKAIKSLQSEGYNIEGITNKGYYLSPETDILSAPGIKKYFEKNSREEDSSKIEASSGSAAIISRLSFEVFKTTDSTNEAAKRMAIEGKPEGTVVLAEEQTAGKGRKGRSFYSPSGTGLYMSIVLRPEFSAQTASLLTTAAAVAVAQAIETVSGRETRIKWVNDVWMGERKVCGILTEASMSLENGGLEFAVVGIGVNVFTPEDGFNSELQGIANSVFQDSGSANNDKPQDVRNHLAAEILSRFMEYYDCLEKRSFLPEYRKRMFFLGQQISVIKGDTSRPAIALDIDENCHLKVRYPDGATETLFSGEISIKI